MPRSRARAAAVAALLVLPPTAHAQQQTFTRADSLQGSYTSPGRVWWDVLRYDLDVRVDPQTRTFSGSNRIAFRVLEPGRELQIDLMEPLVMDSVVLDGAPLPVRREGAAHFVTPARPLRAGAVETLTAFYHGEPREAPMPPWDGGVTWAADSLGRPWIATTDQGLGASVWWPVKDTQADEPDQGMRIAVTVPDPLIAVANGRLTDRSSHDDGTTTWRWSVSSPINTYGVALAIGHYVTYADTLQGEAGPLSLDFWPLDYRLADARRQFPQAATTLQCFEGWFGPYPWYEDGFKLVETPYLGMEHQSAIAYGNRYGNGYLGTDLSGTGLGLQWDYIIVHEIAHEWWGNHVSTKDIADMWVHEGFGTYAEGLYMECIAGPEAGATYLRGLRANIENDRPIIGPYGVYTEGSGDMYFKGAQMLHTIRQVLDDDARWREILRGIQATFGGGTVRGWEVEEYMTREAGIDLGPIFDQYLRTPQPPVLEWRRKGTTLEVRWADVVPGFDMPIALRLSDAGFTRVRPTERWQSAPLTLSDPSTFAVDPDWYVLVREAADR
ncbi:MAG: M1 family metallopeptidase [Gemmatimonadetes bacterium]|nr:M1 family metallopeptidase [Gemmatimonadota bacterium]